MTAEQATDAVRAELKAIAQKAQAGRNQDWFTTAVCALAQFGDAYRDYRARVPAFIPRWPLR